MTKAEAWLQCSARGTTVTRLAYIVGFTPLMLRKTTPDGQINKQKEQERKEPRNTPETPRI